MNPQHTLHPISPGGLTAHGCYFTFLISWINLPYSKNQQTVLLNERKNILNHGRGQERQSYLGKVAGETKISTLNVSCQILCTK